MESSSSALKSLSPLGMLVAQMMHLAIRNFYYKWPHLKYTMYTAQLNNDITRKILDKKQSQARIGWAVSFFLFLCKKHMLWVLLDLPSK